MVYFKINLTTELNFKKSKISDLGFENKNKICKRVSISRREKTNLMYINVTQLVKKKKTFCNLNHMIACPVLATVYGA